MSSVGLPLAGPIAGGFSWCRIQSVVIASGSSAHGARLRVSESNMKTMSATGKKKLEVPYYDFSEGVRGKYAARFAAGTNVVVLSPDVAEIFPDSEAVNEALRTLVRISGKTVRASSARKKRVG